MDIKEHVERALQHVGFAIQCNDEIDNQDIIGDLELIELDLSALAEELKHLA